MSNHIYHEESITNWRQFRKVTANNKQLLKTLDKFPNSILVAGCQRSGTTMVSRIITESEGMTNYWFGSDDELSAALILSGLVKHEPQGRYCFQTTYLDDHYREYFDHADKFKLVWLLRNPFSVAYSLMYNWRQEALENTFRHCGSQLLHSSQKWKYQLFGNRAVSRVTKACLLYNHKITQLFELNEYLGQDQLIIIDYDDLVLNREAALQRLFKFIDVTFHPEYALKIHQNSLQKSDLLSEEEQKTITVLSEPNYIQAKKLLFLS